MPTAFAIVLCGVIFSIQVRIKPITEKNDSAMNDAACTCDDFGKNTLILLALLTGFGHEAINFRYLNVRVCDLSGVMPSALKDLVIYV